MSSNVTLTKLSYFAVQKGISGIAGKDFKCEVWSDPCKMLNDIASRESIGRSPNTHCKGVICTRDLNDMEETEIVSELQHQGITQLKRITLKKEDKIIESGTYCIS